MITVKDWKKEIKSNWVFDKNSQESFIHVCEGKTLKKMQQNKMEIRKHDISVFTIQYNEKGSPEIDYIKFCPYCGCDLHQEE
jgi:hypothetical protein